MSTEDSNTRQRIMEQALRLLVDNRGKNVRMSDIAKAAGRFPTGNLSAFQVSN